MCDHDNDRLREIAAMQRAGVATWEDAREACEIHRRQARRDVARTTGHAKRVVPSR